tara:strand:- start:439 stop:1344 length:906 start_codon:yes stop_codon:yes gene_type:complete
MKTIKIFAYALAITSGFVFTSCGSDDSDGGLPPIGGYDSSDEVAAADLVAKWSFDGDGKESISGAMPATSSGVSYVASDRGQALNLTEGFLKYNAITNLSSTLSSFTISTWVKATNNGASGSVFLSLARPNEWAGNINFLAETGWAPATSDSLTVKGQIVSNNALAWQDTRNAIKMDQGMIDANNNGQTPQHVANANKIGGQWAHCVLVWDGTSRMFTVYVNGQKISNPAWELRGNAESPAFAFTTPTYPVIGAFATFANGTSTDGWDKGMTGQLDEMRVYKKALIQADISALYQLESAGR